MLKLKIGQILTLSKSDLSGVGACFYCSFHISLSKAFWRKLFYILLFLAETFTMCVYRHDVTKVGNFYKGCLWGNFCLLSDLAEILFLVRSI